MKIFKNTKRKHIIITSLVSTFVITGLIITYYNSTPKEEPLIGAYIDGTYSETLPLKGSGYTVEKVVCDNNKNVSWDYNKWGIKLSNWGTSSKCNIYFKSLESFTLANKTFYLDEIQRCPTMNSDGTVTVTGAEDTYGYLCKAKDAYGDSYYYRGNVTNNYVKFGTWASDTPTSFVDSEGNRYDDFEECVDSGGDCTELALAGKDMYWRIVRINGDGTVRVIYDGTSAHANGDENTDRQIGFSQFNSSYNDNAYVGYMYGKIGASTYAETHANTNNSTIKTYIDTWYENNIKGTNNEQYIADNIFCNDRSFASNNSGTGAGTSTTYYRLYNFAGNSNNNKMMLTCPQKNDAFTVSDTTNGNGALTYPIGLITTDEAVLAGGWSSSNSNYYLYSGWYYWTMSPSYFDGNSARECRVSSAVMAVDSGIMYNRTETRPVINLSSEILKNGDGTASNPFHP